MMPFCLMFLFLVWFLCCEIWFRYLKKDGTPENNLHALDITYEIIVEAGVNILLFEYTFIKRMDGRHVAVADYSFYFLRLDLDRSMLFFH